MEAKRRLVTRSDFDGLACAMMLRDLATKSSLYILRMYRTGRLN